MTNLVPVADSAIYHAIKFDHPDFDDGWMDLIPEDSPLNYSDDLDWLHFLGEIVRRYRIKIPGCTCPNAVQFFAFRSKILADLRDALVEATTCS